jgi:hypothetical protein
MVFVLVILVLSVVTIATRAESLLYKDDIVYLKGKWDVFKIVSRMNE